MYLIFRNLAVFGAIFALIGGLTFAQNATQSSTDTVQISSLLLSVKANESGRSITTLDARELRLLPALSLDEVLRYVGGLEATVRNAGGAQADLSIRGSSFQQVLVLVDGLRAKDPLTGHFSAYLPVNPAEIARIEVIRGPASSLYGPDAVGGVINIVTYTGQMLAETRASGGAQVQAGQNKLLNVQAGAVQPFGKQLVSGGVQMLSTDGHALPSGARADVATLQGSLSWGARLGEKWTASARLAYDERDFSAKNFYSTLKSDSAREQVYARWAQAQAVRTAGDQQTVLQASVRGSSDFYRFRPAAALGAHQMQNWQLQGRHSFRTGEHFLWVAGIQADSRSISSSDRGEHEDFHVGAFGTGAWRPVSTLTVNGGLRADWDANYGLEWLPQFNASWRATPKLSLRAGAGRSIRAADFTERYSLYLLSPAAAANRRIGNPDLKAETAWSYEFGANAALHSLLNLSATAFYRDARNQIDYASISGALITTGQPNVEPGRNYVWAQNIFQMRTLGAEAELSGGLSQKQFSVNYRLGYQYIHYLDSVSSLYLMAAARHLLNGNLTLRAYGADLAISGQWKQRPAQTLTETASGIGAVQGASYMLWNIRAGYSWKGIFVFGQVNNVFNKQYSDFPGVWMPGRWASIGAGYRW